MTFTRTPAVLFVTLTVALTAIALPVDFSGLESRGITDKAAINAAQIAIQLGQKAHKAANVEPHKGPVHHPGAQHQGHAPAPAHDHKQNLPKPPPAPHAPHKPSIADQVPKDAFKPHPVADAVRKAHGKRRLEGYELESRGITDKAAINAAQIAIQLGQKAHKAANTEPHKGPAFPRPGLQHGEHAPAPGHKQSLPKPPPAPAAHHRPSIAEQIPKGAFKHPVTDAIHKAHGKRMMEGYVSIDDLD